jgi:WD40 repeat protein
MGTKVLRSSLHSLEINTIRTFNFAGRTFLLTGSEDTKLKIFDVDVPSFRRFSNVATLTTHISSVKCVDVIVDDDFAIAVSAGGRAQVEHVA